MRDRVENMSGEMKLTPAAHPASPARSSLSSAGAASARREKIYCWLVAESLQLSSLFISNHLSSLWFIVPSFSLSRVQCYHFLSLSARTLSPHPRQCIVSSFFFFFFYFHPLRIFSCFLPFAPSPSFQQWLKSWLYWHVSFHHANAGEERGEHSGRGECVLRRKGPSQPRAKPCPSSGEPRRCDSVLLKAGQLLVTLAHRCTHSKEEVTHILCCP